MGVWSVDSNTATGMGAKDSWAYCKPCEAFSMPGVACIEAFSMAGVACIAPSAAAPAGPSRTTLCTAHSSTSSLATQGHQAQTSAHRPAMHGSVAPPCACLPACPCAPMHGSVAPPSVSLSTCMPLVYPCFALAPLLPHLHTMGAASLWNRCTAHLHIISVSPCTFLPPSPVCVVQSGPLRTPAHPCAPLRTPCAPLCTPAHPRAPPVWCRRDPWGPLARRCPSTRPM